MLDQKEKMVFDKPEFVEEEISQNLNEVLEVYAQDGGGGSY